MNLDLYDYLAANSTDTAVDFLTKKGFRAKVPASASPEVKMIAIGDDLRDYGSQGDEQKMEIISIMHPDNEFLCRILNSEMEKTMSAKKKDDDDDDKKMNCDGCQKGKYMNCCGADGNDGKKMSATGDNSMPSPTVTPAANAWSAATAPAPSPMTNISHIVVGVVAAVVILGLIHSYGRLVVKSN